jgi:hypothetical protein
MPSDGIFLQVGNELMVLEEQAYDCEALLQAALAQFPEVMAGSTTTGSGGYQAVAGAPRDGGAQCRGGRSHLEPGPPVRLVEHRGRQRFRHHRRSP